MRVYLRNKADVVQSVADLVGPLEPGSALTMTISRDMSGDFFVTSVTDASSEDIVILLGQFYLDRHMSIY